MCAAPRTFAFAIPDLLYSGRREAGSYTIDSHGRGGSADVLNACKHSETDCLKDRAIQRRCKQENRNQKPMKERQKKETQGQQS